MGKYVYFFGGGKADGRAQMKELLGGKGANLAEMTNLNLPVPPGFTISTRACQEFYTHSKRWPKGLQEEVRGNMTRLEKLLGVKFGGGEKPLLVSVRSGAAVSMPGMMDTVLNLGLNPESLATLSELTGNRRFGWDAYRRLMQMFGDVVMKISKDAFEHELEEVKRAFGKRRGIPGVEAMTHETLNKAVPDTVLQINELQEVVRRYQAVYRKHTGGEFPSDPWEQLTRAVDAVFDSWNNPRAVKYRQLNDIRGLLGTAVNVQAMVFGNMGEDSGTGVCFTRDPASGENKFYGEYLMNAQGEDVVAGIRTPQTIDKLAEVDPKAYQQLVGIRSTLERHYRDMQDIEFTIERGSLYMLQTRSGKRTIFAAVRSAVEMAQQKLITREEAVRRVGANQLNQLFAPVLDQDEVEKAEEAGRLIASGLPASPGGACGQVVFTAEDAENWHREGKKVILARTETSPEDVGGMAVSEAIVTARGGMTSHAAVVARGMGTPCVAGASELRIDHAEKVMRVGDHAIKEGDYISLSGFTGKVYDGQIKVQPSEIIQVQDGVLDVKKSLLYQQYTKLLSWADEFRRLGVRANADIPRDAERAMKMGAEGIGLCRTEHMFFQGDRIVSFRRFILVAEDVKKFKQELADAGDNTEKKAEIERKLAEPLAQYNRALAELLPLQRSDFEGLFRAMKGRPVIIRTLDPPLHEFLPQEPENQAEMAATMGIDVRKIRDAVASLHEFNPMLGLRGCRLGIVYPEVSMMQFRAIVEAALNVAAEGVKVRPEIMIPLVGKAEELKLQRDLALEVIAAVTHERKLKKLPFHVMIGTMIEVPRGAVTADEVAKHAEFFSFGTNDLTQMGCGFSRDDAGKFLGDYVRMGIYDYDPFQVLDRSGIGKLISIACELGRKTRPDIEVGICGEHGGDPMSVEFCHQVGLTYVSCSPFRVPVARLAAAQAALKEKAAKKAAGKKSRKPAGKRKK